MAEVHARPRGARRGAAELLTASWPRTLAALGALLVILAILAALVFTGRLGDIRYANIPLIHPYPPAGYYQNPFNPTDRGDLVNASEAGRVKADLLADGKIELAALANGDPSTLDQADTGGALTKIRQLVDQNNATGLVEKQTTNLTSTVVGHLQSPNTAGVTWCVEEIGTATLNRLRKDTGAVVMSENLRIDAKFWMVRVGGRYLITDAGISASRISQ